jgi:hypothetical protein
MSLPKMTPFQARLVPHIFRWSKDFSRRSPSVLAAAGKDWIVFPRPRALPSKLPFNCYLPLGLRWTHGL